MSGFSELVREPLARLTVACDELTSIVFDEIVRVARVENLDRMYFLFGIQLFRGDQEVYVSEINEIVDFYCEHVNGAGFMRMWSSGGGWMGEEKIEDLVVEEKVVEVVERDYRVPPSDVEIDTIMARPGWYQHEESAPGHHPECYCVECDDWLL